MSAPGAGQPGGQPLSEEELRAAYEAELSRIDTTDLIAQAAVSLLNIGAHRLGVPAGASGEQGQPAQGRDVEQVRDAIDAASALLKVLERRIPDETGPLRDALSRLQMAYAREAQAGAPQPEPATQDAPPESGGGDGEGAPAGGSPPEQQRPGPAESSGRLWVPGS